MTQITICFIICISTMVLYLWNPYKSLAVTGVLSVLAFSLTGCIDAATVTNNFGHTNALLICGMFVIAAGFNKTQFVKKMAGLVNHISKGSLAKVMLGYIALAILMVQFIPSNLIPFCILAPMLSATVEDMGYSSSKVIFPLGLACITTTQILPVGNGATSYASMNAHLATYGSTAVVELLDPFKGRIPMIAVMFLFAALVAPKLCPDKPVVAIKGVEGNAAAQKVLNREKMDSIHEIAALAIFFGTTILLIFQSILGLESWEISLFGASLMIITGILKPREASSAIPIWIYLLFVCGLCMASALTNTGAGQIIGDFVAKVAGMGRSNLLFYTIFFFGPYILTQFILNRTAITMFYPIVIQTCLSLGVNPVGGMICVQAAALSAFVTPMATGTVPYMMGAGGYDMKTMLKMSIVPFFLCAIVTIAWLSMIFPVF